MRRFNSDPRLQILPRVWQRDTLVGRATVSESVSKTAGRELATEFMERHRIVHLVPRPARSLRARMRLAWYGRKERLRRVQQARGERIEA